MASDALWSIHPYNRPELCVEVLGNYQMKGGTIQLAVYTGAVQQQYLIDPSPDARGAIVCAGSHLCLDIGKDSRRGPNIIQWSWRKARNQIFDYNPDTLKIQSGDGRFLDVNGAIAAGATLLANNDRPLPTQQWVIRNVQNPSVTYRRTPNPPPFGQHGHGYTAENLGLSGPLTTSRQSMGMGTTAFAEKP
jgi:hypothetical protein